MSHVRLGAKAQDSPLNSNSPNIMRQVNRMVAFIELEGTEKADAISSKTEEEYHLIMGNDVQNGRRTLSEQYDKKFKALVKEQTTKDQLLKGECQMKMYKARDQMVTDLKEEIKERINEDIKDAEHNRTVLKDCIHQCMLLLLEKNVIIQILERDAENINDIVSDVKKDFKDETEIDCNVRVAKKYLAPKYLGGCVAFNRKCTIKVSNTILDRYNIVMERLTESALRVMLFGRNKNRIFDT